MITRFTQDARLKAHEQMWDKLFYFLSEGKATELAALRVLRVRDLFALYHGKQQEVKAMQG